VLPEPEDVEINIKPEDYRLDKFCATGPGGQHVNKTSSAVQLRFDVRHSPSLPGDVRHRLERLAGRRLTNDGVLVITAQQHRTQDRNRKERPPSDERIERGVQRHTVETLRPRHNQDNVHEHCAEADGCAPHDERDEGRLSASMLVAYASRLRVTDHPRVSGRHEAQRSGARFDADSSCRNVSRTVRSGGKFRGS
jgi:protein subunit release factor B